MKENTMAGRCELCDGKIVNGRCVDCGMDYTRRKNRYHLNENCDDYDRNARKINDAYEDTLRGKNEPQKDKKKKEKTILNGKASAKPNTQRKDEWAFERAFSEKKANAQKAQDKSTGKKSSAKGGKLATVVMVISVISVLAGFIGELLEDSSDSTEYVYSEDVNIAPEYDEDLPEMPETDYTVGFEILSYGSYIAGVDIPAGTYTFTNMEEDTSAAVMIDQPEYGLYGDYYLDEKESVEGIRLYDGGRLRIDAGAVIYCDCTDAQNDTMHAWEGDSGAYVAVSAEEEEETEYIVGEDIAPGRYTVRYEGEGTSVLSIRTQTGTFDEYFSLTCAKYSPESTQYMGLVLKEGDIVYIQKYGSDEAMAEFMPLTKPLDGYYQN